MRYLVLSSLLFVANHIYGQGISVKHIDPFIGTGGHGHTHPAATAPFGMMQLGPDTRKEGWDGCSGYHYSDNRIYGFSHTHLSGTGVSDYADILIRPMNGFEDRDETVLFDKSTEISQAGYYSLTLLNGIQCEMTASERVGIHRYTMSYAKSVFFLIDLGYRDNTLKSEIRKNSQDGLDLIRISESWAKEQHVYASLKVLNPGWEIVKVVSIDSTKFVLEISQNKKRKETIDIENDGVIKIEFAVALSGVDIQGARNNLAKWKENIDLIDQHRISHFDRTKKSVENLWQEELNRAQVYGGSESQKRIYATALYHAFIVPNLWSDADGRYRGMNNRIYQDQKHKHYTVFSLWDTYRTAHPLYILTQPKRAEDFMVTMLDHFDQTGRLPIWELAGNETNCMIGYHSVSVLADAIAKGLSIDSSRALNAMLKTSESNVFGLPKYMENGFLSIQDESESVSKTLEYSYDDACISWTAERLGKDSIASHFWKRSQGWISLFDPETGLFRPRDNGSFLKRFDPREVNNNFTEANSWQYSFSAVHDIRHWKKLLGDNQFNLESQLDALFSENRATSGRNQPDVTGLIGQYAHGNEPSHHIASLYACTGSPEKGHKRIREILETMYSDQPNGYEGNEDCGQMSAWYVMNSWGLYPMVPGEAKYTLSAPIWNRVELREIETNLFKDNVSGSAIYLHGYSLNLNNEIIEKTYITHEDLYKSDNIEFIIGNKPTNSELESYKNTSFKVHSDLRLNPAPIIDVFRSFVKKTEVVITDSGKFERIPVSRSQTIIRGGENNNSHRSVAFTTKKPNRWTSEIIEGDISIQYNPGKNSLVDGIFGFEDYHKGQWLGIQGQDLIINLNPNKRLKRNCKIQLEFSFLKDIKAWIALPKEIQIWYVGENGSKWLAVKKVFKNVLNQEPISIKKWSALLKTKKNKNFRLWKEEKINSIEVHFLNAGKLADWHPGAGGNSYIFIDEISISQK